MLLSTKLFSKVTPQLPLDVEIYPKAKSDRRLAPNIPGRGGSRRGAARRGEARRCGARESEVGRGEAWQERRGWAG